MAAPSRKPWRRHWPGPRRPAAFRQWLLDDGSLTARLQRRGKFSLRVVAQGLATPTADEAALFGLGPTQQARIREVVLSVDGTPLVFAHTVLPTQPRGPLTRWIARLGNRSLGSMLFRHPGFSRTPLLCQPIDRRGNLHRRAVEALGIAPDTTLWARRSSFAFATQRLLVTEIFSPALWSALAAEAVTKTPQRVRTPESGA
ncbi:chorismate--pyruvate lyase family protein [Propionivibrio dicarboxylicus]|uniref:Probable chorismate pyruvate-lyase n=1 Tax=Propionivibrio dicarboxylicus TaxID=83767 RepID=A0A1G8I415_9RHOO|nr:chorismate lyase [Propionivibrio dicarboxylicus]SDI13594.1 chorismate lyase [Propionivibrio dicarboxylicus]